MTTATQATNNEASDTEAILESAKALRPLIEEHRDEMEAQGRMPRVLVDAMLDRLGIPNVLEDGLGLLTSFDGGHLPIRTLRSSG